MTDRLDLSSHGPPVGCPHLTMRDSTTIFDQEGEAAADAESDLTREFWGSGSGWIAPGRDAGRSRASVLQVRGADGVGESYDLDHTPVSLRGIREGFEAFRPKRRWRDDSTGPIERTRAHGVVRPEVSARSVATAASMTPRRPSPERLPHRDASIGELAAGEFDTDIEVPQRPFEDGAEIALLPAVSANAGARAIHGLDPMVVRIALVVIALLVAIPLALVLRNGNEPTIETDVDGVPATVAQAPVEEGAAASTPVVGAGSGSTNEGTSSAAGAVASPSQTAANDDATTAAVQPAVSALATEPDEVQLVESMSVEPIDEPTDDGIATPATVEEAAERTVPDCSRTYTAGEGDSWYRIADEAGVTPGQLMDQNQATINTVIFPGSDICLPPGAAMPSPPTTVAVPKATPTTAPATVAPTPPTPSTAAPTTTSPPPPSSSPAEVQAMIREIWPDDLEERALEIARRESNFQSGADNGWCCVGVFQLYWTAHRSWLDDYGIHSRNDLKDARKNITAAYGLYQRNGGWGPWGG